MKVLARISILALAAFSLWIPPGQAAETSAQPPSPACPLSPATCSLFQSTADELGVPISLTQAIAQVESAVTPYALNIEGQAFSFDSKEEAIEAAGRALTSGRSFDSGIMQINSQWIKRFDLPLEAVFDPAANIYLGSWILSKNIRQYPGWQAVARYHSPDQSRGQTYVEQVKAALKKVEDRKTARPRISAPGSKKLAASLAKEAALLPAVPLDGDEPKGKIVSDAGIAGTGTTGAGTAGSVFVREPATQNRLTGHLVVYRGLAVNLAASGERENPAHVSPAPTVRKKEKAQVFVQRFNGAQIPTFARQAQYE